jgi:intergrase/recombinase
MEKTMECIKRFQENQNRLLKLLEEQGQTINEAVDYLKKMESSRGKEVIGKLGQAND